MTDFNALTLAYSRVDDTNAILDCVKHEAVRRFVSVIPEERPEEFVRERIEESAVKGNYTVKMNGEFAGCAGLHPQADGDMAEIGYFLLPQFQGKGLGSEIVKRLIAKAKQQKISLLYATAAPDNLASIRVLQKNGFIPARTVDVITAKGEIRKSHRLELYTPLHVNRF